MPWILWLKIHANSLWIIGSLGFLGMAWSRSRSMPALTHIQRSSAVSVATEMLYAMFHAWKTQTRGKRGCRRVIACASSIDS